MPARRSCVAAVLALSALALALVLTPAAGAAVGAAGTVEGTVPLRGMNVVLFAAKPGAARPRVLGATRSGAGGRFTLRYRGASRGPVKYMLATRPGGGAEAGFPVPGNSYRLASAIGAGAVPRRATVNERTTVAMGYAMAQFIAAGRVAGKDPGLRNAAAMTRNLVGVRGGGLSPVLAKFPNGGSTSTLRAFDSLANLLAACRAQSLRCAAFLNLARVPGGAAAGDTLAAATNLARYPWHASEALFKLSRRLRARYRPVLHKKPAAWTLALRFEGSPRAMDGPGDFAIDAQGSLWVGNNYEYSRESSEPTCFGKELLRFTPTGRPIPALLIRAAASAASASGSRSTSATTSGPATSASPGPAATRYRRPTASPSGGSTARRSRPTSNPPAKMENEDGELLKTFKGGWEVGEISWPQATVADVNNNIWVANCGNDSVTEIPNGEPGAAVNLPKSTFVSPRLRLPAALRRRHRRRRERLRRRQRQRHGDEDQPERRSRRPLQGRRPAPADGPRHRQRRQRLGLELDLGRRPLRKPVPPRGRARQRWQRHPDQEQRQDLQPEPVPRRRPEKRLGDRGRRRRQRLGRQLQRPPALGAVRDEGQELPARQAPARRRDLAGRNAVTASTAWSATPASRSTPRATSGSPTTGRTRRSRPTPAATRSSPTWGWPRR